MWDKWGECDAECGGGMQKRVFRIKTSADAGGAPCEAEALETQFRKCNLSPCDEDCQGDWGPWSKCGDGGVRDRKFTVYRAARGKGAACEASSGDTAAEECAVS